MGGSTRLSARSPLPEEFHDLPEDCVERIWDALLDEACGAYMRRDAFDRVFGTVDSEVKVQSAQPAWAHGKAGKKTQVPSSTGPLAKLFALFELASAPGWTDAFEVLSAIILASNQLARREKLDLLAEKCMLVSPLNTASAVNGASLALDGRRALEAEEGILECTPRDLHEWIDRFPHRPVRIQVKVLKVSPDVVEEDLKITVGGRSQTFAADGTAQVHAQSGEQAVIGTAVLALRGGRHALKTKADAAYAEVLVTELDGVGSSRAGLLEEAQTLTGDARLGKTSGMAAIKGKNNGGDEDADEDDEDAAFRARLESQVAGRARGPSTITSASSAVSTPSFLKETSAGFTAMAMASAVVPFPPEKTPTAVASQRLVATAGFNAEIAPLQIAKGDVAFAAGHLVAVESAGPGAAAGTRYFDAHSSPISALAVHPNGRWIVSAAADSRKIIFWDAATLRIQGCIDAVVSGPRLLSVSRCASTLLCLDPEEGVYAMYEISSLDRASLLRSGRLPAGVSVHCAEMTSKTGAVLAGSRMLRLDSDGEFVSMRWGKTAPKGVQTSLAVMPDMRTYITASLETGQVYVWTNDTCIRHRVLAENQRVYAVAPDPSRGANIVACGLDDGAICLVSSHSLELVANARTPQPAQDFPGEGPDPIVRLSPGAAGLVAVSQGGIMWRFNAADQAGHRWRMMRAGHRATRAQLKWAWTSPTTIVSASDSDTFRLWRVKDSELEYQCSSRTSCRITALAGIASRVFVATEDRAVHVVNMGKREPNGLESWARVSQIPPSSARFSCSIVPYIDELAVSEDYVAASCSRARIIEIRAVGSGKLLQKLSYEPLAAGTTSTLRFVKTVRGGLALVRAQGFAWDAKTWKPTQAHVDGTDTASPSNLQAVAVGSTLVLREQLPEVDVAAYQGVRAPELPSFLHRVIRVGAASAKDKTAVGAVICSNNKTVRAVAVEAHADPKSRPVVAVATDQALVQVNDYKLRVDGVVQALALGRDDRLAVSTSRALYVFHHKTGILLATTTVANEATLGLEFVDLDGEACLARVTASGGIQVWQFQGRSLSLHLERSRPDASATCLCAAGVYGAIDGTLRRLESSDVVAAEHAMGAAVLSIHQDKLGFVTGSADGSVKLWSAALQEVQLRKSDRTSFPQAVVAVFRNAADQELLVLTVDGGLYANRAPIAPHLVNASLALPKVPSLEAHKAALASASPLTFQRKLQSGWRLSIGGDRVRVVDQSLSCKAQFTLDDQVKEAALSPDETTLAVASRANDLYILNVSTATLLYFWPSTEVLHDVQGLQFVGAESSRNAKPLGAAPAQATPTLLVNGAPFAYKT